MEYLELKSSMFHGPCFVDENLERYSIEEIKERCLKGELRGVSFGPYAGLLMSLTFDWDIEKLKEYLETKETTYELKGNHELIVIADRIRKSKVKQDSKRLNSLADLQQLIVNISPEDRSIALQNVEEHLYKLDQLRLGLKANGFRDLGVKYYKEIAAIYKRLKIEIKETTKRT